MHDDIASGHRRADGVEVGDLRPIRRYVRRRLPDSVFRRSGQHVERNVASSQSLDEGRSDKAAAAGYENARSPRKRFTLAEAA